MYRLSSAILCLTAMILLASCSREKQDTSNLRIALPQSLLMSVQPPLAAAVTSQSTSTKWGLSDPTTIDQMSCYAVFLGGPVAELSNNVCSNTDGTKEIRFGRMVGLIARGDVVTFDNVPSGPGRTVYVVGMALKPGSVCEPEIFINHNMTAENYSNPMVVGQSTRDLNGGDVTVDITTALSDFKLGECNFNMTLKLEIASMLWSNGDITTATMTPLLTDTAASSHFFDVSTGTVKVVDHQGNVDGISAPIPYYVSSITKRPENAEYFGLLQDGTVVQIDPTTGAPSIPSTCPLSSCQVPVWFQSIALGKNGMLYGLDHGGQLYRVISAGVLSTLVDTVNPAVEQISIQ